MAAATPVSTVEALVRAVEKSGLLSSEKLASLRERSASVAEPKLLARELIKDGTLTRWQAEQLLNGYYRLVLGKYKLLDQLASTPTGRLYLAEHAQIGRRHTLKVLAKRLANDAGVVKHFLESAKNACALDHRNINHVYDVNHDPERKNHYVVMEYVEGQTLESLVEENGPLELLQALDYVSQAAEGLRHAHQNGVVHGDLKPANLLREQSGTIKILEIGQAGAGAQPETESPDESVEMAALAAVIFQAPELRGDGEVADVAGDVYSLGSVLVFLLTGKAARDAEKATALLNEHGKLPPPAIELCCALMADKPADRPPTMNAVIERLNEVARGTMEGEKPRRTPPPVPPPAPPPPIEGKKIDGRSIESKKSAGKKQESVKFEEPGDKAVEKIAAEGAESSPAVKKPPMARSLDDEGVPPIIVSDEPRPVIDPEPIGQIVIKTKGRAGKKPAAKPVSKAEEEAASETIAEEPAARPAAAKADAPPPPAAQPKEKPAAKDGAASTPLLLAGAIGGGGVLALGLLIAVIWYVAFGRSSKTVATAPPAKSAAPAAENAGPVADAESNPISPASEQNPVPAMLVEDAQRQAAAASDSKLAALPGGEPATAPASPPTAAPAAAKEAARPEATAEPKAADASGSKPDAAKPAVPKPAEAPPKKKSVPKPAAPKPAAKAAPKIEPFKGFEVAVDLPPLPETAGQSPGEALTAIELGPCRLDDKAPLLVVLHGGETAIRTPRQKFELQGKPGGRAWDVLMSSGDSPAVVATIAAQEQKLMFQWTGEALKQAPTAQQLANCALELTSDKHRHVAALRLPVLGEPLVVEIDKAGDNAKWLMGNLPSLKSTFLEVTRAEGFKPVKQEPKEPVNPGTTILVWVGPKDKPPPLALKLTSTANLRGVTVNMQPQVKLEGVTDLKPYRRKEVLPLQPQAARDLEILRNQLEAAKRKRPSTVADKAVLEGTKTNLTTQVDSRAILLDQLAFLADFTESTAGNARLHFRVYHQASDNVQVDLLITENGSEAKPDAKK
jgi:serine/threonine protein kinase